MKNTELLEQITEWIEVEYVEFAEIVDLVDNKLI